MSQPARGPWWALLYALLPLLGGLFYADSRIAMSAWGHRGAQVGIVVLVFGLTERWIHWNEGALARSELAVADRKQPLIVYVWSVPECKPGVDIPAELPAPSEYPVAAFPLPGPYDQADVLSISPKGASVASGAERIA